MDANNILILLAFVVIIYLILRRFGASGESMDMLNQTPPQIDWQAVKNVDVQLAMQKGNKIEAIKRYREETGVGLAEAKQAIEYAMAYPQAEGLTPKPAKTSPADWVGSVAAGDLSSQIRDLLSKRQKIQAVKLYREQMGVGLKEAKDAVDDIERTMNL